jgi:hypothetical protein
MAQEEPMRKRRRSPAPAASLRNGGIQPSRHDPLRHAPLREPYATRSGAHPAESGTAETVTRPRRRATIHRVRQGR